MIRKDTNPARSLCAHADDDGDGMHWLEPGEVCEHMVDPQPATQGVDAVEALIAARGAAHER